MDKGHPMAHERAPGLVILLIVWIAAADAARGAGTAEADAAFDAGDQARALMLYEDILREDSNDLRALVRSAMLLSWDRRYVEAAARYDRVLALDPTNETALLERAKVLSWDSRFGPASGAFRAILDRDPGNREARLGLARSLSWGGSQPAARAEYRRLAEADPGDAEAILGVAQTHAWSGDLVEARRWYEQALRARPGMKDARIGLAWLDLWSGRPAEAERAATELSSGFPGDTDVKDLHSAIRRERRPWVRAAYDRVDDTDGSSLDIARLEAGWGLAASTDVRIGVARHDVSRAGVSGSVDSLYGVLDVRPAKSRLLAFRLGIDRLDLPAGESEEQEVVGGATWTAGTGGPWQWTASAERDTWRYSPEILADRLVVDAYAVSASRIWEWWRASVGSGLWEISDANRRVHLDAGIKRRFAAGRVGIEAGYAFRTLEFRRDRVGPAGAEPAYFDPQDFTAHLFQATARGNAGRSRVRYDVTLEGGVQSFTVDGARVTNDTVLGGSGVLGIPVSEPLVLELFAARTDYALQSGTGFRSRQLGLRLRWRLGT